MTINYIEPDNEDDRSMKIYEMSNHRGKKEVEFKDDNPNNDDSEMKFYSIR